MSLVPWSVKGSKSTIDSTDELMLFVPSEPVAADKNKTITGTNVQVYTENITLHTGIRRGLTMTVASGTTFDVAEGEAIIVDKDPNPLLTVVTQITKAAQSGIIDTNLSQALSHIVMDAAGTITVETDPPQTLSDITDRIHLGDILHVLGVIVDIVPNPIVAHGTSSSEIANLVFGGGTVLQGGVVSANGANLKIDISPATLRQAGRGFTLNKNSPNEVEEPAQTPIPIGNLFLSFIDGSGNLAGINTVNDIDPTLINTGGLGTLLDVGNNNFSIIRFFAAARTGDVVAYYGTKAYNNLNDALTVPETTFTEHPDTRDISFVAKLIIKKEVTDLAAAIAGGLDAVFVPERIRI